MKSVIFCLLVLLSIIIISCKEKVIIDQIYTLKGKVIDNSSGLPIEGVLVGIKNPSAPDSMIFLNDSINRKYPNGFVMVEKTDSNGKYNYGAFLGHRSTALYKEIFAFKLGYKLWRFQENIDQVEQVGELNDVLNIRIELK
jgi:hypothetical protein